MNADRQYPDDAETFDGQTDRPPPPDHALRFDDPADVREWLRLLKEQVDEGFGTAEDATRPFRERVFSRYEARRRIEHAEKFIRNLLDSAERGLT